MSAQKKPAGKRFWTRLGALPEAVEGISRRLERIEETLGEANRPAAPASVEAETAAHEVSAWNADSFRIAPPLRPEHTEGARLFADRDDALQMLPTNGRIAEVGVALGNFSRLMLDRLVPTRFDAFDIFRMHHEKEFWGKTSAEWLDNLPHQEFYERRFAKEIAEQVMHVHAGDSSIRLAEMPDGVFDMIYIDGDHSYEGALRDALVAERKIKTDGILVFNDYVMADFITGSPYGVVPVVNEMCVNKGFRVIYMALQGSMFCDIALRKA